MNNSITGLMQEMPQSMTLRITNQRIFNGNNNLELFIIYNITYGNKKKVEI